MQEIIDQEPDGVIHMCMSNGKSYQKQLAIEGWTSDLSITLPLSGCHEQTYVHV